MHVEEVIEEMNDQQTGTWWKGWRDPHERRREMEEIQWTDYYREFHDFGDSVQRTACRLERSHQG